MVNETPLEVENVWFHRNQVIFKFKGIDSITEAERLVGGEVTIPMEERPVPPDGEYYQTDLIGCQVEDADGAHLGVVEGWQECGGPLLLEVRTAQGKELLIPFAKSICKSIDAAGKRIVVDLPEGLVDLD